VANLPGITIGRPNETCAASGEALTPGERIVSVLLVDPGEGSHRLDVAEARWDGGWRPTTDSEVIGVWRGVMPAPRDKADARPVDDEDMVALFDQITEPQDEQAIELRYVLAWMLVRRRRLRFEGQRKGCLRVRRVSATGAYLDDAPIDVADPGLDEDQLEQAMERVAGLLLGEAEPEPTGQPAGDAS
jgi:hypothetical protein